MHSIECSSQGWPKFPQPSEWTNFPHATLSVSLNQMMAKYFDVIKISNNLTQDYRKVKEESKETTALEVVTDGKNDKTENNTTREHGNTMCIVLCATFFCVNR